MISGSNWKTVDDKVLGGLERHTYTATDAVLRNVYFGPTHAKGGNRRSYAVDAGDTFKSATALKPPAARAHCSLRSSRGIRSWSRRTTGRAPSGIVLSGRFS